MVYDGVGTRLFLSYCPVGGGVASAPPRTISYHNEAMMVGLISYWGSVIHCHIKQINIKIKLIVVPCMNIFLCQPSSRPCILGATPLLSEYITKS